MYKEQFTAEEWETLEFAPLWAFGCVASRDDNIDENEQAALCQELSDWASYKEPLAQEVFLSVNQNLMPAFSAFLADSRDALVGLEDVADLLERKVTPEQAHHFKGALILLARKIGEASGDGFSAGDGNLSEEETTAIVILAKTLRFTPS